VKEHNREKSFIENEGWRGIGLTWGTIPAIVYTDENQRSYNNKPTEKNLKLGCAEYKPR
jgi:hypothetical protein